MSREWRSGTTLGGAVRRRGPLVRDRIEHDVADIRPGKVGGVELAIAVGRLGDEPDFGDVVVHGREQQHRDDDGPVAHGVMPVVFHEPVSRRYRSPSACGRWVQGVARQSGR